MDDFGAVLQCMDGRPQRKVADYVATSFGVRYMDNITTAGLVRHLAETTSQTQVLLSNLEVSVKKHGSRKIAVVAHHECVGNPVPDNTQRHQIGLAIARLSDLYPDAEVIGLWVGEHSIVERVRKT